MQETNGTVPLPKEAVVLIDQIKNKNKLPLKIKVHNDGFTVESGRSGCFDKELVPALETLIHTLKLAGTWQK